MLFTEGIIFETNNKQCGLKLFLGPPMRDLLHSLAIEYFKKDQTPRRPEDLLNVADVNWYLTF